MSVIRLVDDIKHHISCRAHGHDEYNACSEGELGLLSEDENVHAELIKLDQVTTIYAYTCMCKTFI